MCRSCADGGRRCSRANQSRTFRTVLTERLARNRRVADDPDISTEREQHLRYLITRDEAMLGVLRDAMSEHGEVVTGSKDSLPGAVVAAAPHLPQDALVNPSATVPTVESAGLSDAQLRRTAAQTGEVTGDTDGSLYVRTRDGQHLRLVNTSPTAVYTTDGVRVNLMNMVIDPHQVTNSKPSTHRLNLTAVDQDALSGDPESSLRGLALTAGPMRGVDKSTMDTIRSNASLAGTISASQRRRSWETIANGDRPDRAMANLRLAGFEGVFPGLEKVNSAEFRTGMKTLSRTMKSGNVSPTMRAEMMAGYLASHEDRPDARRRIVAALVDGKDRQDRALFYADTNPESYPTDLRDVSIVASHAHSLGTTVRERCMVANATRVDGTGDHLRAATKIDVADGLPKPVVTDKVLSNVSGVGRAPLPQRRVAMNAAQAHEGFTHARQAQSWLTKDNGKGLLGYIKAHTRIFGRWGRRG